MEDFHSLYMALAIGGGVVGGILGLIYSFFIVALTAGRRGKATWEPIPFVLAFAFLWPALLVLSPLLVLHEAVEIAKEAEKPWAVRAWQARWFDYARRFVFGLGAGIMACYVAGFFL